MTSIPQLVFSLRTCYKATPQKMVFGTSERQPLEFFVGTDDENVFFYPGEPAERDAHKPEGTRLYLELDPFDIAQDIRCSSRDGLEMKQYNQSLCIYVKEKLQIGREPLRLNLDNFQIRNSKYIDFLKGGELGNNALSVRLSIWIQNLHQNDVSPSNAELLAQLTVQVILPAFG